MMRALIPIFMGLLSMVASRTEPIDFSEVNIGATGTRDHRNEIFFPSGSINAGPNDFPGLMALDERRQQINLFDDGRTQPRDSKEQESIFEPDALTTRKIFNLDDIDGSTLDDLDEASRSMDELDENDLNHLSTFLMKLLRQPTWEAPLVIVGEPTFSAQSEETDLKTSGEFESPPAVWKRSRYYRRYPWKRQNARSRHGYDYDAAYLCQPSREDVFQLLVALHDVRQGNKRRVLNFCKRRRSAGTVFTNIRFLGRRK